MSRRSPCRASGEVTLETRPPRARRTTHLRRPMKSTKPEDLFRAEKERALTVRDSQHARLLAEAKAAFDKLMAEGQAARKSGRPRKHPLPPLKTSNSRPPVKPPQAAPPVVAAPAAAPVPVNAAPVAQPKTAPVKAAPKPAKAARPKKVAKAAKSKAKAKRSPRR